MPCLTITIACPSLAVAALLAQWLTADDHFASYMEHSDHGPVVLTTATMGDIINARHAMGKV